MKLLYIKTFGTTLLWLAGLSSLQARTITDMAGRKVTVPDHITRVAPYDNKTNVILYSVAGSLMISKARTMESPLIRYISSDFIKLREVDMKNAEEVLKLHPEVIIVAAFTGAGEELSSYLVLSQKTGIPMVFVNLELMELDKSIEFLGQLLGRSTEAKTCASFIREVYGNVSLCRKSKPTPGKAYLANDNDGLRTTPAGSNHGQVFDEMNIPNVAKATLDAKGFANVAVEQVMVWAPDFIFCVGKGESSPYRTILKSALWKNIPAVKSRKVYAVPSEPYLWFDMPPSVNRILGLIWFSNLFYGQSSESIRQRVTNFYQLFYHYPLSEKEYNGLFAWK